MRQAAFAEEVDKLRAAQAPATPDNPFLASEALQPEATPEQPGESKLQRMLREDASFRSEVEQFVGLQQQQQAAYGQALAQTAVMQRAMLFETFPELANLNDQQLAGALHVMAAKDPARHGAFMQRAMGLQQVVAAAHQQVATQQQHEAQKFHSWAANEDAQFDRVVKDESIETRRAVQEAIPAVLEKYNVTFDNLLSQYRNNPVVRSSAFQAMLYDLTKYHMAKDAIPRAVNRPVPQVVRPGVSEPQLRGDDGRYSGASKAFNEAPTLANAAALISSRRAARGGR